MWSAWARRGYYLSTRLVPCSERKKKSNSAESTCPFFVGCFTVRVSLTCMPVPTLDGVCTHTALSQRVVITQTTECDRCCEPLHGRRKCEYINIGLVLRPHLMFGETAPTGSAVVARPSSLRNTLESSPSVRRAQAAPIAARSAAASSSPACFSCTTYIETRA